MNIQQKILYNLIPDGKIIEITNRGSYTYKLLSLLKIPNAYSQRDMIDDTRNLGLNIFLVGRLKDLNRCFQEPWEGNPETIKYAYVLPQEFSDEYTIPLSEEGIKQLINIVKQIT